MARKPSVIDAITNAPVNQGENPVPRIERVLENLRGSRAFDIIDVAPREPLTVEVTLNARDSEAVEALAEEEYRTPAQQVGYIVHQWFDLMRKAGHGGTAPPQPAALHATPPPAEPRLIPVYHRGDGSAGSGCGKVGLLFARPLEGKTIGVGDVFKTDETPWTKEDGPLTCCQCGGAMVPSTWTYEL